MLAHLKTNKDKHDEKGQKIDGDLLGRVVFSSKFGFCPGRQFAHREPGYSTLKLGFLLKRWTKSGYFVCHIYARGQGKPFPRQHLGLTEKDFEGRFDAQFPLSG